ncbi:MAG: hypothetical protein EZS28_021791 [Streblomastix strix]|uniref:Uncharacterized protein n=1 Tax=Streblomastix strix TaxID=222440 RepID=A0A5J4VJK9_9EUKA|nr:MAG: hypothetical protein EZS28_021791 [Streblomastix strix]
MTLPRVFASDLDGTLTRWDGTVDVDYLGPIMRKLQEEKGVDVVLISARPCLYVAQVARSIALDKTSQHSCIVVGTNGSEIFDLKKMQMIKLQPLCNQTIDEVIEFCRINTVGLEYYEMPNSIVCSINNEQHQWFCKQMKLQSKILSLDEIKMNCHQIPPSQIHLRSNTHSIEQKVIPFINSHILKHPQTKWARYYDNVVEISPSAQQIEGIIGLNEDITTDKGSALRWLCKNQFNCSMNDVCAIGDGDNDMEMLQQAGFSYAPANSSRGAKQSAKVTLPWENHENCVGKMIKMLFFGESKDKL